MDLVDIKQKVDIEMISEIISKTIGSELVSSTSVNEKERKEYEEFCKKHKMIHISSDSHIKEPEYKKGRRPYILTNEDIEIIKELLHNFKVEEDAEYYINDFGQISVRTPNYTWMNLCGREWLIDKEKRTCKLVCMN